MRNGMECGMEHGMEYEICLLYHYKDNYVTTPTFRGVTYYPLLLSNAGLIFICNTDRKIN